MSGHIITTHSPLRASLLSHVRIGAAVALLRTIWRDARRAASSRRNLEHLDAHMLADIGISRAQADFEAARWR